MVQKYGPIVPNCGNRKACKKLSFKSFKNLIKFSECLNEDFPILAAVLRTDYPCHLKLGHDSRRTGEAHSHLGLKI